MSDLLSLTKGSYDEKWLLSEEQCRNLCGTIWYCVAIEYSRNGGKGYSKCELHKELPVRSLQPLFIIV